MGKQEVGRENSRDIFGIDAGTKQRSSITTLPSIRTKARAILARQEAIAASKWEMEQAEQRTEPADDARQSRMDTANEPGHAGGHPRDGVTVLNPGSLAGPECSGTEGAHGVYPTEGMEQAKRPPPDGVVVQDLTLLIDDRWTGNESCLTRDEHAERTAFVREKTKLTTQPRNKDNGCCLTASLLNIVEHPMHKRALLGHGEPESTVRVERKEAYARWEAWQSGQCHGDLAKYRLEGLRGWLGQLKEQGILDWFAIEPMKAIKRDASILLNISKTGKAHPPRDGEQEGYLVLGYCPFDKKRGMKGEVGRVKLIEREIGTRLLGMSVDEARESGAYRQAWENPKWVQNGKEPTKGKVHPLTRFFPWEAEAVIDAEAISRIEDTGNADLWRRERLAHHACVQAECEVGWQYRMRTMLGTEPMEIRNEATAELKGTVKKIRNDSADDRADQDFVATVLKRVKKAMDGHERKQEIVEHIMQRFVAERERAHQRYPADRSMGLTTHAVCVRINYADNEAVLLDPARRSAHVLSDDHVRKSTEELMLSLVDFWSVLRVRFAFTNKYHEMGPKDEAPRSHREWQDLVRHPAEKNTRKRMGDELEQSFEKRSRCG